MSPAARAFAPTLLLLLLLLMGSPPPADAAIQAAVWRTGAAVETSSAWAGVGLKGAPPMRRFLACSCSEDGVCGCCAPIQVPQVGFNQTACITLTFVPTNLTVILDVGVGGRSIVHTSFSANSPPPLCLPVPQAPFLALCVRLQDVSLQAGPAVRACPSLEAQVMGTPVLVVVFDCVRVGPSGVAVDPGDRPTPAPAPVVVAVTRPPPARRSQRRRALQ